MKEHIQKFSIVRLCRLAKISRSGYYEWLQRKESQRAKNNRMLLIWIRSVFNESHQTYGSIRIHRELRSQGQYCGKNRIARLMRSENLRSVHRKKYRYGTTNSNQNLTISPNILNQDFSASRANEKWGCDISYIQTAEGWLYIAVVLDFYSRKIVGFAAGRTLHSELCCQALQQACLKRKPSANLVHHSDRGAQYASSDYRYLLERHRFIQSMSRKGNCYDNSMVESFFHTLKVELTYRKQYISRNEAAEDIKNYIEYFYNTKRRHSSLDYMSPNQYEIFNHVAA